ncbi:hypothetical protein GHT06_013859 [Daphnia sinensis]|uniref:Uncharacterized protein n=1 Tax=Daphnia sinensis TaxID=1820382 RepID=A0AAD5KVH5_9CRUS|nr:hypothetical protein GHT06_013859 [Daphnia sinensis]
MNTVEPTKPITKRSLLKLPGMQNNVLIYDTNTGHVFTFPDFKCADSQFFALKSHALSCDYFNARVDPAKLCTAKWKERFQHSNGHGPPGRLEMEMVAFWWQVIIYILTKYRGKTGDEVIELVYSEWPFTMKQIFRPKQLSKIMHSTLEQYQKLALANGNSHFGRKRAFFIRSHNQLALDSFIDELKRSTDWWGPYNPAGTPVLCCIVSQISTHRSSLKAIGYPSKTSSKDVDQGNPGSLEGLKQLLEVARKKADEKEKEAERLRRALAYLNYSIVADGSELNQERIDEIIIIGEMAEKEGIEPGYLMSSTNTVMTDESKFPATICCPSFDANEMFAQFRPVQEVASLACSHNSNGSYLAEVREEISQTAIEDRFAELLTRNSKKISSQNGIDVFEVPLIQSIGQHSTFERYAFGEIEGQKEHRKVLVLGTCNLEQSKFINGIINFIFDVNTEDNFRFQLIREDVTSETEAIQVYDIHHVQGFSIPFSLTIVNVPSYVNNDVTPFRDKKIVKLLLDFLQAENCIQEIDMICYVIVKPGNSVLSVFGSDLKKNTNCWQPSEYLSKNCKWRKYGQTFFTVLSTMKAVPLKATEEILEEMNLLRTSVENLRPIFRARSEKLKKMENVKLMITTYHAYADEELCIPDGETSESKRRRLSSEEDLLGSLQKDIVSSEQEIMTALLSVLHCFQRLKKISPHNPFLSQKLYDLVAAALLDLEAQVGRNKQAMCQTITFSFVLLLGTNMNYLPWIGWNPPFLGSLLAFLVTISYWLWSRSRFVRLVNALPGPKALPLLGNVLDLNVPHDELLKKSAFTWVREYGGIYRVWFTVRPMAVIASPEFMEVNDHWRKSRRLLNPSFHVPVLNTYMDVFNEKSSECVQDFEEAIQINNGAEFDVYPLMNQYTTRAICGLVHFPKLLKRIIQYRFSRPWLRNDWLFKFTAMGRENAQFARGINDVSNKLIQKRREFLDREAKAQNNLPSSTSGASNSEVGKKLGFLDLILKESEINNNFSKDEIRYEGHDTSALGLTWFLYNISRYPEHQKLLSDELNAVFGNSDRPCTTQDLTDLKYLDCCVKESLRLYPSVPFILRCLPEDTKIGDYNLPKGLMIGLSIVGLHYNPQVFPDPEVFKPERFFAENNLSRHRFAYSAFGAGPRNCIGQKFVMLQMKVNIVHLIRRFSFSLANPTAPLIPALQETTLTPKYPIKLIVSKRTN